MDRIMLYGFFFGVITIPAIWWLIKVMYKRGQLTENAFVLFVSFHSWFIVITLSRAITTNSEFKAGTFILFLLVWYPSILALRRVYRRYSS